jgi:hypothetical protein
MNEEIVKVVENPVTKKMCDDFLFTAGTNLNEQQKMLFYNLAVQFKLNPFKREIYAISYGEGWNFVTGYQAYIQRAEATGKLNGWHCTVLKDAKGGLAGAKIIIHRKDFDQPFEWEVSLSEFDKDQSNWKKMPEFMIKKVCIGQGFRLAFPNELGGMPYLQEELEDLIPQKLPIQHPQAKSEAKNEALSVQGIVEKVEKSPKSEAIFVTASGGEKFSTFDKRLAEAAKALIGQSAEILYTTSGKYKNLVSLTAEKSDCTKDPLTCDRSTFDNKDSAFCDYDPIVGGNACQFQVENA